MKSKEFVFLILSIGLLNACSESTDFLECKHPVGNGKHYEFQYKVSNSELKSINDPLIYEFDRVDSDGFRYYENKKENISIKYHPAFNEISQSGVDIVMKCKIVVNN